MIVLALQLRYLSTIFRDGHYDALPADEYPQKMTRRLDLKDPLERYTTIRPRISSPKDLGHPKSLHGTCVFLPKV
jgi:hypothetical protein